MNGPDEVSETTEVEAEPQRHQNQPLRAYLLGCLVLGVLNLGSGSALVPLFESDLLVRTGIEEVALALVLPLYGLFVVNYAAPLFTAAPIMFRLLTSSFLTGIMITGVSVGAWFADGDFMVFDRDLVTMLVISVLAAGTVAFAFQLITRMALSTDRNAKPRSFQPRISDLAQWTVVGALGFALIRALGTFDVTMLGTGFLIGMMCVLVCCIRLLTLHINRKMVWAGRALGTLAATLCMMLILYGELGFEVWSPDGFFKWMGISCLGAFLYWFLTKVPILCLQALGWSLR